MKNLSALIELIREAKELLDHDLSDAYIEKELWSDDALEVFGPYHQFSGPMKLALHNFISSLPILLKS